MEKFYIIVAHDHYYPNGGVDDIAAVTHSEEDAYILKEIYKTYGVNIGTEEEPLLRKMDYVEVYCSDELPWVK